jgi:hypothetical protein
MPKIDREAAWQQAAQGLKRSIRSIDWLVTNKSLTN